MATTKPPDVGDQLGSYRIEGLLGRGGMGVVYRATDLRLGRQVALKLLAAELTEDGGFRERFLRESRAAASIDHPGVLPVYAAGDVDGLLFIAMRLVRGEDLGAVLRREGALEPSRTVALVEQLADALDVTHARGLVHRDVKPGNVLVATEGAREHAYLTDFGITKVMLDGQTALTDTDALMGTADYVAPEVIRGDAVDGRADIYSLGCLLHQCLTGRVPFPCETPMAAIYAHLEQPPPPPSSVRRGLPAGLDAVVARALAKDPAERFQHAGELAAAAAAAVHGVAASEPRLRYRHRHRRPSRRRVLAVAAGLAGLAAAAVVALAAGDGGTPVASIDADAVAVVDQDGSLATQIPVGASPSHVATSGDAVWVTNADDQTVSRIDRSTRRVVQTVRVGASPSAIAAAAGGVWVANGASGTVSWIAPDTDEVVKTIPVGNGPSGVCVMDGAVWVAAADDRALVRLDAQTGRRAGQVRLDREPTEVACGDGRIWVTSESSGSVLEVDARSRTVAQAIDVGRGASGVAIGAGSVWVANTLDGTVSRIDPEQGAVVATVAIGSQAGPAGIAVGAGGVWVAGQDAGTLARIDPGRNAVTRRLRVGGSPQALAVVDRRVWVGVRDTGARHRGGTLRVMAGEPLGSPFDPATVYSAGGWQVMSVLYDGLTAFRRAGGPEGARLVPDLAVALPTPVDGGRTYAFRLRRGVRYWTGAPVRAGDFRRALERAVRGPGASASGFFDRIRGVRRCAGSDGACDLSAGIVTDDAAGTVVIRLNAPDPDLLHKLALPFAAPVPPGTGEPRPGRFVPGTGPYRIAGVRGADMRLVRNEHFASWSAAARPPGHPDAMTIHWNSPGAAATDAVRTDRADVLGVQPSPGDLATLRTRYAGRLHEAVAATTEFYFLNTRVPPFDNADARRALNYAVDRRAVIAAEVGPGLGRPTCQILPPSFPGHRPYCPYTTGAGPGGQWSGPDLDRAARLVARSGTRGARVGVWTMAEQFAPGARVMVRTLRALGYRASLHAVDVPTYFAHVPRPRSRIQVGVQKWAADYPAPSSFLRTLFGCAGRADVTPGWNWSRYCDPTTERLATGAQRLQRRDPAEADAAWAAVDRRIVDEAAAVPLFNPTQFDFVSTRVRGYRRNPQWGLLLDQLSVR